MPNGRSHKSYDDYGPHKYPGGDGRRDCEYGCGCWASDAMSGSPIIGIFPSGHCPNNPLDGQKQPGNDDYEDCVNGLIQKLRSKLHETQKAVRIVETAKKSTKVDLSKRVHDATIEIGQLKNALGNVHNSLSSNAKKILEVLNKSV